ncbi:hypothetical protein EGP91_05635 [bacterium]|nr:hypothetical protein [bacterium]
MNALLSDEVMNEERSMFKKARDYGREEGIDIGKNEGKKEERILIAKELLKIGIPLEKITIATGLSKEELKKLEVSTSF